MYLDEKQNDTLYCKMCKKTLLYGEAYSLSAPYTMRLCKKCYIKTLTMLNDKINRRNRE